MVATTQGEHWDIPIGVDVYTADLHRLGVLTQADAYELVVEDGVLVHHTYTLNLSDVDRYEDGVLVLKLASDQVAEDGDGRPRGRAFGRSVR